MCPLRQPCRSGSLSRAGSQSVSPDGRSIKTLVFFTIKLIYLAREKEKKITCKRKLTGRRPLNTLSPYFEAKLYLK